MKQVETHAHYHKQEIVFLTYHYRLYLLHLI